jgi:hypothetical protein
MTITITKIGLYQPPKAAPSFTIIPITPGTSSVSKNINLGDPKADDNSRS